MLWIHLITGQLVAAEKGPSAYALLDDDLKPIDGTEVTPSPEEWVRQFEACEGDYRPLTREELEALKQKLVASMGIDHWTLTDRECGVMTRTDGLQFSLPHPHEQGEVVRDGKHLETFITSVVKAEGWGSPFDYLDDKYPQVASSL